VQLVRYKQIYCAPGEQVDEVKAQLTVALNSHVSQNLIRNQRDVTGLHGTYVLEPAGLLAAGQVLGLSNGDINMVQGLAPKKLKK